MSNKRTVTEYHSGSAETVIRGLPQHNEFSDAAFVDPTACRRKKRRVTEEAEDTIVNAGQDGDCEMDEKISRNISKEKGKGRMHDTTTSAEFSDTERPLKSSATVPPSVLASDRGLSSRRPGVPREPTNSAPTTRASPKHMSTKTTGVRSPPIRQSKIESLAEQTRALSHYNLPNYGEQARIGSSNIPCPKGPFTKQQYPPGSQRSENLGSNATDDDDSLDNLPSDPLVPHTFIMQFSGEMTQFLNLVAPASTHPVIIHAQFVERSHSVNLIKRLRLLCHDWIFHEYSSQTETLVIEVPPKVNGIINGRFRELFCKKLEALKGVPDDFTLQVTIDQLYLGKTGDDISQVSMAIRAPKRHDGRHEVDEKSTEYDAPPYDTIYVTRGRALTLGARIVEETEPEPPNPQAKPEPAKLAIEAAPADSSSAVSTTEDVDTTQPKKEPGEETPGADTEMSGTLTGTETALSKLTVEATPTPAPAPAAPAPVAAPIQNAKGTRSNVSNINESVEARRTIPPEELKQRREQNVENARRALALPTFIIDGSWMQSMLMLNMKARWWYLNSDKNLRGATLVKPIPRSCSMLFELWGPKLINGKAQFKRIHVSTVAFKWASFFNVVPDTSSPAGYNAQAETASKGKNIPSSLEVLKKDHFEVRGGPFTVPASRLWAAPLEHADEVSDCDITFTEDELLEFALLVWTEAIRERTVNEDPNWQPHIEDLLEMATFNSSRP